MITRSQYLAGVCSHETYYRQFVVEDTLRHVNQRFTVSQLILAHAEDEHLNSIPLKEWDSLTWYSPRSTPRHYSAPFNAILPFDRSAMAETGESVTRAFLVCVAKQAARMLIERASING